MSEIIGKGYLISGENIGIYAGATTRPEERIQEHFTALQNQRHWNLSFQAAFNEHGLEKFSVSFTPPVTGLEEIAKVEQELIDRAKASNEPVFNKYQTAKRHHPVGYSLSPETRERQSRSKRKRYEFVSPEGDTVSADGLVEFCKLHDLTPSEMCRLAAGKIKTHKNWTRKEIGTPQLEKSQQSTI